MKRKGAFDIRIRFENEKIFDNKLTDIDQVDDVFKTLKKKFK